MTTLAQESTTLAEGPTITVSREQQPKTGIVGTYLHAQGVHTTAMRMRVDDVAPASLRQYLDLMVRAIRHDMVKLTERPTIALQAPSTIHDFVHNMAQAGMFTPTILSDVDTQGNTGIQKANGKVSRKSKRKNHQSHTG